jgi:hypothetical protein
MSDFGVDEFREAFKSQELIYKKDKELKWAFYILSEAFLEVEKALM